MMPQGLEPAVEAALLRGVLDDQSICLLRVGTDGVVLAANDTALNLVGADGLGEALGMVFTAWVAPEHHSQWQAFLAEVSRGTPASLRCDLITPSGAHRAALLHGVALDDHPDGSKSIAVAVHLAAAACVGDTSVEAHVPVGQREGDPEAGGAKASEAAADRQRLEAAVRDLEDRLQRLSAEYEAEGGRFGQTTPESPVESAIGQHGTEALDEHRILLAVRDTSVWHQFEISIGEREVLLGQLESDLARTRAEFERTLAEGPAA